MTIDVIEGDTLLIIMEGLLVGSMTITGEDVDLCGNFQPELP